LPTDVLSIISYNTKQDSKNEIYLYFNSFDIPSQIKKDFNDKTNVSTKNLVAKIFPLTD
jgi:hypothetical protein